jgi:hypothetical protein
LGPIRRGRVRLTRVVSCVVAPVPVYVSVPVVAFVHTITFAVHAHAIGNATGSAFVTGIVYGIVIVTVTVTAVVSVNALGVAMPTFTYAVCEWCLASFQYEQKTRPQKFCCRQHQQLMYALNRSRREAAEG